MRLTSDFWCSAFMRQIRAEGGFAYLTRRGSQEAGAIFILFRRNDGFIDLYAPAPQSAYQGDQNYDDRQFMSVLLSSKEDVVVDKLEKELRFDPDLWLVEVENYNSNTLPHFVHVLNLE
ncbi:DUF1491 family protein [Bartonella tamiae]|uniref:DUF1491 family protein n=1 Tax=Bartonella tamiae Th239 TaxID=1094558 RepID=J0R4I6_9HYPH|nr:DUF1491 family protein [Bartonella tamiae]EJF90574.1 hypothetical protein ME5_00975 [Bartonella tamiae Th239]EJF94048.1 hypothetical protein MEG_00906 [Bartonella tamiae Th307]